MSEPEFSSELVERCAAKVYRSDWWNSPDFWRDIVRASLSESGHAELVAALKDAKPYVWTPAHFKDDKRAAAILDEIDAALRKAGAR